MTSQIQLENPFLEGVNSFYLLDGDPVTLVDTGVSTPETIQELESKLRDEGTSIEAVDQILLTHWHTDHAGLAGDVQERSGATVYAHRDDAGLSRQDDAVWDRMFETFSAAFDEWGMSTAEKTMSLDYVDTRDPYWGAKATVESFTDGETFETGEGELRAINLPGHTLGSVCYVHEARNGIFTGDTLLPGYTPNIGGGEFREMESLLETYLASMHRFLGWEYEIAWPGHRGTMSEPSVRARTILQHHWDRLTHILTVLRNYDVGDVRSLADHIFGALEELHVFIGCAETAIHLEYLLERDLVADTDAGYVPDPDADLELDQSFEDLVG